ncbi:uncharacterized protein LOC124655251 [Lolium rigidum]|uniref:uncharacterized protein LOC124655251 n=1 Tax=Lolium rigidum TaxID=89674 RepID=UPI001F5DA38C|nr:uncharacterized protein LOC124655251 [Lolium rigidum]
MATIRVDSLLELETIAKKLFGARRIQLPMLTRLRDAPDALAIVEALCSDYAWEVVGGTGRLSAAAKVEEELNLIGEVTIPRLEIDITTEGQGSKADPKSVGEQHEAMRRIVHQVSKLKEMSGEVSNPLVSSVEKLVTTVTDVLVDLPITEDQLDMMKKEVENIRDSTVHLEDEEEKEPEMLQESEESEQQQQQQQLWADQAAQEQEGADQAEESTGSCTPI